PAAAAASPPPRLRRVISCSRGKRLANMGSAGTPGETPPLHEGVDHAGANPALPLAEVRPGGMLGGMSERFLQLLGTRGAAIPAGRAALVVAHPDDETLGLGGQLPRLNGLTIIHVTDGAPRNRHDASRHGFATAAAYAAARRRAPEAAVALA